ncbi:hypothetical protein C9I99_20995 [Photobacterium lutimaris]|uniref:VRR-NUC domain-containing protein n=2 Tax=Photobacterium lutimaris TaxID=388278 RepID=A0A2T3ITI0_9GAMM|nr:hypothetical protein C9I99_20995 [Photobacterium lutimaris]
MSAAEFRQLQQAPQSEITQTPTKTQKKRKSKAGGCVTDSLWHSKFTKELSRLHKTPDLISKDKEYFYQVKFLEVVSINNPSLEKLTNASPNGGRRVGAEGFRMVAAGLCKGFPDLQFCVPRLHYHGLFIEMKKMVEDYRSLNAALKEVSYDQHQCRLALLEQGYLAVVAYGFTEALEVFNAYISNGELPDHIINRWHAYDIENLAKRT